jgi:hypothetical protein
MSKARHVARNVAGFFLSHVFFPDSHQRIWALLTLSLRERRSRHGVREAIRGGSECRARYPQAAGFASNVSARRGEGMSVVFKQEPLNSLLSAES